MVRPRLFPLLGLLGFGRGRSTKPARRRVARLVGAVLLIVGGAPPVLRADPWPEYDLKAAMLMNLAVFVDWPDEALPREREPLIIAVLGLDPFGAVLDAIVAGQQVKGRRLLVRRLSRRQSPTECHVLFIARSEVGRLPEVLEQLAGRPVLTVSDIPGFTGAGGMIGLAVEDRRVVLYANPAAMKAGSLTASSKLLRLSRITSPAAKVLPRGDELPLQRHARFFGRS